MTDSNLRSPNYFHVYFNVNRVFVNQNNKFFAFFLRKLLKNQFSRVFEVKTAVKEYF